MMSLVTHNLPSVPTNNSEIQNQAKNVLDAIAFTLVKPKAYEVVLKVDTKLFCGHGLISIKVKMYELRCRKYLTRKTLRDY
jgi:hypothetical protein